MNIREVPTIVLELSLAEAQAIRELALFVESSRTDDDVHPELYHFAVKLAGIVRDY